MNLEEDFNKEIKDKLDSRTFEYSEASWEKANALIQDAQKKKKRRFFFYLLSAGVILLITIFCFQYPFGKIENTISQKLAIETITKQEVITAKENKQQNLDSNNDITNQNIEATSTNENAIKEPITSNVTPKKEGSIKTTPNSKVSINKVNKSKSNVSENKIHTEHNYSEHTKGEVEIKMTSIPKTKNKNSANEEIQDSIVSVQKVEAREKGKAAVEIKNFKKDSLVEEKPIEIVKTNLPAKDSTPTIITNTLVTETKKDSTKNKIDKLQIFAFAGVAFTPGYIKNISIKESVNPSVGIFIRKTLKTNFGTSMGLFYTIYGNIVESPKVFKNTTQDFGYKNETTEIKQSRLHYLKLPIMLDYNKGKNNFSIGAQFMYLVTSSSRVTTYKESYGLKADNSSKKVYGYTNGFSSYDVSVILGYRRQITNKVSIQTLLDFGFMDVKNNSYFNSTAFDRNKSLQLNLGYKLFSK